jgi:hypothetical protein
MESTIRFERTTGSLREGREGDEDWQAIGVELQEAAMSGLGIHSALQTHVCCRRQPALRRGDPGRRIRITEIRPCPLHRTPSDRRSLWSVAHPDLLDGFGDHLVGGVVHFVEDDVDSRDRRVRVSDVTFLGAGDVGEDGYQL